MNKKLQYLTQGSKSVEDYHKQIEVSMIQAKVYKNPKATMVSFQGGLDKKIANTLELQHYIDLEGMVHMATKIEQKLKFKGPTRGAVSFTPQFNSRWPKRDESKKLEEKKDKPPSTRQLGNPKALIAK